MKLLRGFLLILLGTLGFTTSAATFESGLLNVQIPDGNPSGFQNHINVSGLGSPIASVSVTLNVSGGWNGDLYAYLSYGGQLCVLLNRVGRDSGSPMGSGLAGMAVTLADVGAGNQGDIHTYAGAMAPSGLFQPDGRNVDPRFVKSSDARATSFANFNNLNPNGTWTLFFADMSKGDQSTLNSWSLSIQAVPEPANPALASFGVILLGAGVGRRLRWGTEN